MVNRNLIREFEISEDDWNAAVGDIATEDIDFAGGEDVDVNQIVEGKILRVEGDFVLVDVGYKSEGTIPLNEWEEDEEPPELGQMVKVLIEDVEDATAWSKMPRHDRASASAKPRRSKPG